jgi:LPPG:FO 2-phospho-L-lactate transferase
VSAEPDIVVLTGGVGGAKLVRGLALASAPERICAIVNTGDDFRHLGLHVSPDVDTLLYTLSAQANRLQGWGREGETWSFMAAAASLGAPDWFRLGDGDLALHVLRSARLADGDRLSAITSDFATAWGVRSQIVPMTDDPVATIVDTDEGALEFQRYFVERRCVPKAVGIRFDGAEKASASAGALLAIGQASVILIAPSNPYLSIDPILAIPELRTALAETRAPIVAVSPIIAGQAVKGPTAKLMREFGAQVSNEAVADHYGGLIDGLLIDTGDSCAGRHLVIAHEDILMTTDEDRRRVAEAAVALARRLISP